MPTLMNARNLALAAGFASTVLAFGASSSAQASEASLFACKGTKANTEDCCHRFNPKPLWFKQSGLNCNTVVQCHRKYCYIKWMFNESNGRFSRAARSKGHNSRR